MSTMTATVRGTPSLTVAATQNTAPVFEFRCLYTHDLRKKKKIWHDGSLRFHTFNRRVMVYDDSKNYIGDAHWRETGDFNEGEELRLDKGVMVEVGERIGHTETDLTPVILEKRHQDVASSPPRVPFPSNTYPSAPRRVGTILQGRPKSLAAVLGASQGPIGRARVTTRSPFEQRRDNIPRQLESHKGPPAKRPRTTESKEKENLMCSTDSVRQIHSPALKVSGTMSNPKKLPNAPAEASLTPAKALEISTGNLFTTAPLISSRLGSEDIESSLHEADPVAEGMQSPTRPALIKAGPRLQNRISASTASNHTNKPKAPTDQCTSQAGKSKNAKVPTRKSAASMNSLEVAVVNKLRFAKEKPRRKLIYRDLLPHVRREKRPSDTKNSPLLAKGNHDIDWQASENSKRLSRGSLTVNLLSDDEEGMPGPVRTPTHESVEGTDQKALSPSPSALPMPSPLFVEQSQPLFSLTPPQQSLNVDFEPPLHSRSQILGSVHCDRPAVLQISEKDSPQGIEDLEDAFAASEGGDEELTAPQAPSKPTLSGRRLLQRSAEEGVRPKPGIAQEASKQRSFRRIQSEGDSQLQRRSEVSSMSASGDGGQQLPEQLQKPFRSPTKVQRSVSDTTHLAPRPAMGPPVTAAVEAGFDPWSEPEAYLLFDWWPPGREKPSFAVSES